MESKDPTTVWSNQYVTPPTISSTSHSNALQETKCMTPTSQNCSECGVIPSIPTDDQLLVCSGCNLAIHRTCYRIVIPLKEDFKNKEVITSYQWTCDCCNQNSRRDWLKCIYCDQSGSQGALKCLNTSTDHAFYAPLIEDLHDEHAPAKTNTIHYGHVLCMKWDPRRLATHMAQESRMKPRGKTISKKENVKKPMKEVTREEDDREMNDETIVEQSEDVEPDILQELMLKYFLPSGDCCFCHSSRGSRIQCHRVNCARDFHVMCAYQGSGHVELRTRPFLQFHAYCDRHRDCTEDIGDLLAKLITRPIRLLVGRDDMRRFGTIAKHLLDYDSAATVMRDLAALLVGYCNKGLRASKNEPPDYNVKHLQVLQFFLGHVPQLEKVYALPPIPAQDFVNDPKLFRRLERTFDPPRYMATSVGPFSQQYTCDVCLAPFHERQHLFYCCREDKSVIPHVQHWGCTKRASIVREREKYLTVAGSSAAKNKRKAISIVQNGVRKDITVPKGLSSMANDVICGVCSAKVDVRGLVTTHKEAKSLDFEKKESKFVQNGCYINPVGAKGYSYEFNASSRKAARSIDGGKSSSSSMGQYAAAQQVLGPPKMDRINVQRTTKWLACVAQIIRLVGTSSRTASAETTTSPAGSNCVAAIQVVNSDVATSATTAASAAMSAIDSNRAAKTKPLLDTSTTGTSAAAKATREDIDSKSEIQLVVPKALSPLTTTATTSSTVVLPNSIAKVAPSLVTPAVQALFDEVMRLVRPYDSYALSKLETAYEMLLRRSGPGVAVLRMFAHEYTRFVYIKHTRAVEKARNKKRKRAEHDKAQKTREKERNRVSLEAERALKKQMLAMRNKQRQQFKTLSFK